MRGLAERSEAGGGGRVGLHRMPSETRHIRGGVLVACGVMAAGCAEPVVEMKLVLGAMADTFDTSCVTAVEVHVKGANYPADLRDFSRSCLELGGHARMGDLADAIRGRFSLAVPASGISGIEVFGWSGPSACTPSPFEGISPDLVLHARAPYIGQEVVDLRLVENLSCDRGPVKIRPVDVFGLLAQPAPSSDDCAAVVIADDQGGAGLGTLNPRAFGNGVAFFGGVRGAAVRGGVASFTGSTSVMNPQACLSLDTGSVTGFGVSCAISGGKVCAAADELEAPLIDGAIANDGLTLDEGLLARYPGMVYVSVWSDATPRRPVAGATIDIAEGDGRVVYIDPPPPGGTLIQKRAERATGPSGLAVVFTNTLAPIKVSAGGATRTVTVSAPDFAPGGALIVLP
jgi:hypothetical protein